LKRLSRGTSQPTSPSSGIELPKKAARASNVFGGDDSWQEAVSVYQTTEKEVKKRRNTDGRTYQNLYGSFSQTPSKSRKPTDAIASLRLRFK
jgi:hypothetical protein